MFSSNPAYRRQNSAYPNETRCCPSVMDAVVWPLNCTRYVCRDSRFATAAKTHDRCASNLQPGSVALFSLHASSFPSPPRPWDHGRSKRVESLSRRPLFPCHLTSAHQQATQWTRPIFVSNDGGCFRLERVTSSTISIIHLSSRTSESVGMQKRQVALRGRTGAAPYAHELLFTVKIQWRCESRDMVKNRNALLPATKL